MYSPNSPLGGALIDAKVGETRSYTVPNGNTVKVTLVSAEPYHSVALLPRQVHGASRLRAY